VSSVLARLPALSLAAGSHWRENGLAKASPFMRGAPGRLLGSRSSSSGEQP